jgi:hypothetical protein
MSKLRWPAKVGLVLGGYVLACLATGGAMYVYESLPQDPAAQASAGMSAFGDLLGFIGLLGFLALFPTGLGLYFVVMAVLKRLRENADNTDEADY